MLSLAFASDRHRRSEVATLMMSRIEMIEHDYDPILSVSLGRTKTTDDDEDAPVYVAGAPILYFQS